MTPRRAVFALLLLAAPAGAQLALPVPPVVGDPVEDVLGDVGDVARRPLADVGERLAAVRMARIDRLLRDHPDRIERDDAGQPARRGEVLLVGAPQADLATAQAAGFALIGRETIPGLDLDVARLAVPADMPLRAAIRRLRRLLPGREITADQLMLPGGTALSLAMQAGRHAPAARATATPVGLIDSGVATHVPLAGERGFATGAPRVADHGTAVASLLRGGGVQQLYVADVFGNDPAGGNSLAVVRALGWLVAQRVPVISISLVGADNGLLRRAVVQATARGAIIVAAVGNDGPAAPPAYPASYPQVIAVTGVDGRNRVLIEAGRSLHLDYAAPGADIVAMSASGRTVAVRGTSYATPLVAARLAHALSGGRTGTQALAMLDAEAVDLGRRGPDSRFGRGLLCGSCGGRQ